MRSVKHEFGLDFHARREVNTPHPSNQTPEAGSSEYWEIGGNRRRREGLDGPSGARVVAWLLRVAGRGDGTGLLCDRVLGGLPEVVFDLRLDEVQQLLDVGRLYGEPDALKGLARAAGLPALLAWDVKTHTGGVRE